MTETAQPAFLKFTPSVERGIRYAIAALEVDAIAPTLTLSDGTSVDTSITADELLAAARWLRYVMQKKRSEQQA